MMRLWKDFRTNLMYWRFRHITRNRLRLKSWWARRRSSPRLPRMTAGYPTGGLGGSYARPRGGAAFVYRRSQRRSWIAFLAMVVLLTAVRQAGSHWNWAPGLVPIIGSLIIFGAIYWALRGV